MGVTEKNKPRALIIDDEVDICYLLKGILRHRNIEADYVTSLSEAKTALDRYQPPVIFLDNHLSDGLGIDYIRPIKEQHPGTIVIMITAHDTAHDRETAYKEGVDYFIGKPFTREIILQTMEKIAL
ncbi:MAG TPA: response regulator [Chitinophagaceae bacterium]|jgi:DNA-binding response OmpR family regulator|nr:response regulator [Chitinophagaceae bacterium]